MDRTLPLLATCLLLLLPCTEGKERVYYVGIIEDAWNYSPSGKNLLSGQLIEKDE